MTIGRALFRLLIGALGAIFMVGSTVSALEAASAGADAPMVAMPMKSDCTKKAAASL
jgi:hypothetical protein